MPSKKKPVEQAPPHTTDGDEHLPILEPAQQTRLSKQKAGGNNGIGNNSSLVDDTTEDTEDADTNIINSEEDFDYTTYLDSIKIWDDNTYQEIINKVDEYGIDAYSLEHRLQCLKECIEIEANPKEFSIGKYRIHTTHDSVVIAFKGYKSPDEYRGKIVRSCPGFSLYHPEAKCCSTCSAKLECFKAQMFEV